MKQSSLPAITICDGDKTFSDNWALSEIFFNFFMFRANSDYAKYDLYLDQKYKSKDYLKEDFNSLFSQLFEELSNWVDNELTQNYPEILDIIFNEADDSDSREIALLRKILRKRRYSSSFKDFEDFLQDSIGNFFHSIELNTHSKDDLGRFTIKAILWNYMPKSNKFAANGCRGNCSNIDEKIKKLLLKSFFLGVYSKTSFGNLFRKVAATSSPTGKTFGLYSSFFVSTTFAVTYLSTYTKIHTCMPTNFKILAR